MDKINVHFSKGDLKTEEKTKKSRDLYILSKKELKETSPNLSVILQKNVSRFSQIVSHFSQNVSRFPKLSDAKNQDLKKFRKNCNHK